MEFFLGGFEFRFGVLFRDFVIFFAAVKLNLTVLDLFLALFELGFALRDLFTRGGRRFGEVVNKRLCGIHPLFYA